MLYLKAMRIVKEPETRKKEILDAAEKLFADKGYETATVSDILDDDYFKWTNEETAVRIAAFLTAMERTVGAKAGSFSEFTKAFTKP